jgi:hypothetical protein
VGGAAPTGSDGYFGNLDENFLHGPKEGSREYECGGGDSLREVVLLVLLTHKA